MNVVLRFVGKILGGRSFVMAEVRIINDFISMWPREVWDVMADGKGTLYLKTFRPLRQAGIYVLYRDETPYYIGRANMLYLMPAEHDAVFSNYTTASRRWKSVTPVLQSGYHNGDAKKRAKVYAKMFAHAGLPVPVSLCEIKNRTDDFKVSTKHGHDKLPRVNLIVEFAEPVSGVVAIGTGRYSGLGIFANL
jgi:CRISPR-associated protein Csb2